MRFISLLVLLTGTASAFGAYTVQSRFSEVTRVNWDDQAGTTTETLGTTTSLNPFLVPSSNPNLPYQSSALTATGATYIGSTGATSGTGPPFGTGSFGRYETSTFQLVFNVSTATDFSVAASLRGFFSATSVLKLDPLSAGASAARMASAAGLPENNFAATIVNWTGTLAPGTYRLSLVERGERSGPGNTSQLSLSSMTLVIPAPGALVGFATAGLIAVRRRRG